MALSLSPQSLARRCARRPWTTIIVWGLILLAAIVLVVTLMGDALTTNVGPTGNPESEQARDLISERFRSDVVEPSERIEIVLVRSTERTVEDPVFQSYVENLFVDFLALGPDLIPWGTHFYQSGDESLVSLDRHTTALIITIVPSQENWKQYFDLYESLGHDQWPIPVDPLNPDKDKGEFLVHSFSAQGGGEVVIIRSSSLTVENPVYRQFAEDLFYDIVALGRSMIWGGMYYYSFGEVSMVSEDRHATLISLSLNNPDKVGLIHTIIDNARNNSDFDISITGNATVNKDFNDLADHDLKSGELQIGLPIAVFVLILVFGALAAAVVPLTVAIVSIAIALGLAMLFAQAMNISVFLMNMIFMMGLAVGIDYCLFIIARYREERAQGWDKHDAIERTGATASRAVLFSGITVFLALIALMLVPHDIFISLGLGAVLVVLVSIAATLTLLPALLSLLGDRVNALRIPFIYRIQAQSDARTSGGMWDRISRTVMRAPIISILLGGGLLVAAAVPLFNMNVGTAWVSTFPDSFESKKGLIALERDFSAGLTEPAVIVVDGVINSPEVQGGINNLLAAMAQDDAFGDVSQEVSPQGNLVVLEVPVGGGDAYSEVAMSALKRLRGDYIPSAFSDVPARVLVTGQTAEALDHVDIGNSSMRVIIPFILLLSFILLTLVFRSLVVPVKAVIMNLLSVGAAYGLLVLVFQKGVGNELFGFDQVDTIEWWVPAFLFAVLFGLSMDYHVFLLSRIRERFFHTHDNADSVAYGIRSTGRLITGAALIMVAVFAGFASGDLVMFQQMGFGLAVAVLLDATIIRSVLVPASMKLLGERNWYLPSWLDWLPTLSPEGALADGPTGPGTETVGEGEEMESGESAELEDDSIESSAGYDEDSTDKTTDE
ncbi:MAG: MMPL family transporter [Dehalococcoidales bacterium]|nr:MAG: MMPL family transporter [Dehalococcoidales bacterium]